MPLDETTVFERLASIKRSLITLDTLPERHRYARLSKQYSEQLEQMATVHKARKQQRDRKRIHFQTTLKGDRLVEALAELTKESQQDGIERRRVKQARSQALEPVLSVMTHADQQIQVLKRQYKSLSRRWQAQMQADYFSSLAGRAESGCAESLLVPIVFQDKFLIVVNKSAGLLSVPGRRPHLQDSVVSRLQYYLPERSFLQAVHRLDQDTSGLLVVACSPEAHRDLSRQFARRQVHKTYEAVLSRSVAGYGESGTITLPLSADPKASPKQMVDLQQGKSAVTAFKVLSSGEYPRVEFMPQTGRTHQLRLHAADGLRSPILGDELYGGGFPNQHNSQQKNYKQRLHLHATALQLVHPINRELLRLSCPCPF